MKKLFFYLFLFCTSAGYGQIENAVPPIPNPPRLVVDQTETLTPDQKEALERKLVAYNDSTSNQISVVIVPSTGDYEIGDYAFAIGRKWGVGSKDFNNGIVFLIAIEDREVYIATGYGLEGAIPDITAKRIIENEVVPNFKGKDYYRGIDYGTDALIKAAEGEYKAPIGYGKKNKGRGVGVLGVVVIFLIILFILSRINRGGGGSFMSRRGHRDWSGPPIWWFPGGGSSGGSGWGGGGSGGGGFGGFGGGSFGGGGAGGSW